MTKSMFYEAKGFRLLAVFLAAAGLFVLAACAQPNLPMLAQQAAAEDGGGGGSSRGGGPSFSEAVQLVDGWNNGNIATAGESEWFKFTASAPDQYVHFKFGGLDELDVEVYDSTEAVEAGPSDIDEYDAILYEHLTGLTPGATYSIKVSSGNTGTYQILVNDQPLAEPPANQVGLTDDTWSTTDDNIATAGEIDWFEFTPLVTDQYIHVKFGTLNDFYVQVYDSSLQEFGSYTNIYGGTTYKRLTGLTPTQKYYIKVWAYNPDKNGTYDIKYNASAVAEPPVSPTSIDTADVWKSDGLAVGEVDWFTFIPSASDQYIHVKFGTLTDLNVQVYDSGLNDVSSGSTNLYDGTTYKRLTGLTSGQTYYIRVWPWSSGGTYEIKFNASYLPDAVSPTSLTDDTWNTTDGNISAAGDMDLFEFTLVAPSHQYIHFRNIIPGSLYVRVYNSTGQEVGGSTSIDSGTTYKYLNYLGAGTYSIRVHSDNTGAYDIKVNTLPYSDTSPSPTSLTPDTWEPGDVAAYGSEWFSFSADAAEQYVHFNLGTLNYLYVAVYNSSGQELQGQTYIDDGGTTMKYLYGLTPTDTYYVKVWPYNSSDSGTYDIGVTGSETPPVTP